MRFRAVLPPGDARRIIQAKSGKETLLSPGGVKEVHLSSIKCYSLEHSHSFGWSDQRFNYFPVDQWYITFLVVLFHHGQQQI